MGWQPRSSGYGRRLTFLRSWVRIPAQDTRWKFTFCCCKYCNVYLKEQKMDEKEARDGQFKKVIS